MNLKPYEIPSSLLVLHPVLAKQDDAAVKLVMPLVLSFTAGTGGTIFSGSFRRRAQKRPDAEVDQEQASNQTNPGLLVNQESRNDRQTKGCNAAVGAIRRRNTHARYQAVEVAFL